MAGKLIWCSVGTRGDQTLQENHSIFTSIEPMRRCLGQDGLGYASASSCMGRSAYSHESVDLFLMKSYDLANKNPCDLIHHLVPLKPFPIKQADSSLSREGYCIREIDFYVTELHRAADQYFSELGGQ
jgi:hypothetical protein